MWQTIFPDKKKEILYQQYCNRYNSRIYNTFILYLIIPILFLCLKGLLVNGEITEIVKKSICIIFLFYFSIRMSTKLIKNHKILPQEEEQMSTAETDSSFEENGNATFFLEKKKK